MCMCYFWIRLPFRPRGGWKAHRAWMRQQASKGWSRDTSICDPNYNEGFERESAPSPPSYDEQREGPGADQGLHPTVEESAWP